MLNKIVSINLIRSTLEPFKAVKSWSDLFFEFEPGPDSVYGSRSGFSRGFWSGYTHFQAGSVTLMRKVTSQRIERQTSRTHRQSFVGGHLDHAAQQVLALRRDKVRYMEDTAFHLVIRIRNWGRERERKRERGRERVREKETEWERKRQNEKEKNKQE